MTVGRIVILNGAPRSGKSSIVRAIQEAADEPWLNLGVDVFARGVTPAAYQPGIGLRPGGERPDLEPWVARFTAAMYESVAAHSRLGLDVVVDVGHHDHYSSSLGTLPRAAAILDGLPAFLVGVRCPVEVIMQRRDAGGDTGGYVTSGPDGAVPDAVHRWQRAVHEPGIYDVEVDTSVLTAAEAAEVILRRVADGPPPDALSRVAAARPGG